jgi:hypothetical protein
MSETKKIIKKMVSVPGQKEKIPMFICPAGMSGSGIDLERTFDLEEKQEAEFEVTNPNAVIEETLKEDLGFVRSYQRYCDEGEITSPEVEDFVYQRHATKYYDAETDRQADLTTIFRN